MPDAAAHLAARSRSRAGCDAHPPTDCPAREMADARYAGHRDPPDRAGARPESVPGNHLPQALRCARSSPGCGSRALRKQYGPGRTRRPGPRIIGKTKCAGIQNQMRLFGSRISPKRKATKISHTHKKTPFERQSKAIRTVFCIRPAPPHSPKYPPSNRDACARSS